ncbi:hypothetical protein M427DRAFT_33111 [Gonapodya prolifera JEL478]|uniref:Uncharacterized protein n=1 Tax=Gonapodya prolifera (strain JEL478) TaxID=1344416 RepID=A0A139ACC2_GONPJ|nr:hypothetical protein M427DRAFT_33111 [Gonapodya prolifera JEL478]|eukprot:KXS14420.1 hypothetical protein M427DRAFT_33111 [Gonapodya prolifera JEL478]
MNDLGWNGFKPGSAAKDIIKLFSLHLSSSVPALRIALRNRFTYRLKEDVLLVYQSYSLLSYSPEDYLPPMFYIIFPDGLRIEEMSTSCTATEWASTTCSPKDRARIALNKRWRPLSVCPPPKEKPSGTRARKDGQKDKRNEKRKRVQY